MINSELTECILMEMMSDCRSLSSGFNRTSLVSVRLQSLITIHITHSSLSVSATLTAAHQLVITLISLWLLLHTACILPRSPITAAVSRLTEIDGPNSTKCARPPAAFIQFYCTMLSRAWYCHTKSSVHLSVTLSYCGHD